MHTSIIQQLIKIIFFTTIGLPIGLKSFAQETIRFYMELDTPCNGIKVGQELELKYICTADFDSVSPPDFGTLIENVKGPIPHKAGHTVRNGILTDIYEQGFSYRIRFKKSGGTQLPSASIKANGKEYETPLVSVWVHPADSNIDRVKCSIQLNKSYHKGEQNRILLTCNRRPDSQSPRLLLNGIPVEPSGNGSSISNKKEKYDFYYTVTFTETGNYTCSCENLSFGGTPYQIKEVKFTVKDTTGTNTNKKITKESNIMMVFTAIGIFLLIIWLLARLLFHKQKK